MGFDERTLSEHVFVGLGLVIPVWCTSEPGPP